MCDAYTASEVTSNGTLHAYNLLLTATLKPWSIYTSHAVRGTISMSTFVFCTSWYNHVSILLGLGGVKGQGEGGRKGVRCR